ncbi:MAG: phosphoribosylglycinamide formyltransferase [Ignavibacteria bacterium]|nr:phosphoribosylglycinamide formyltransferase [Ignavibacteria bacterium]
MLRLGFFASHGGSNMQSIIDAIKSGNIDAKVSFVISNNSDSGAIERAKRERIPYYHVSTKTHYDTDSFIREIIRIIDYHNADTIILAGYMKKLDDKIISYINGRVLNIHPALLPKYGGKGMYGRFVHEAVLANNEKKTGPTVHLVDNIFDHGRILAQIEVPVLPGDNIESLSKRVLEAEHILYPETIRKIASGVIII